VTVGELIAELKTFEPDTLVICRRWSDLIEMEEPQPMEVFKSPGREEYEQYHPNQWEGSSKPPEVIKACFFQGN
jgi:hypothetical protein